MRYLKTFNMLYSITNSTSTKLRLEENDDEPSSLWNVTDLNLIGFSPLLKIIISTGKKAEESSFPLIAESAQSVYQCHSQDELVHV